MRNTTKQYLGNLLLLLKFINFGMTGKLHHHNISIHNVMMILSI